MDLFSEDPMLSTVLPPAVSSVQVERGYRSFPGRLGGQFSYLEGKK